MLLHLSNFTYEGASDLFTLLYRQPLSHPTVISTQRLRVTDTGLSVHFFSNFRPLSPLTSISLFQCPEILSTFTMRIKSFQLRRMVILSIVPVLPLTALAAFLIVAIIRATQSSTDISEFVKALLPAGNCLCQSSTIFDCRLSRIDEHQGANGLHVEPSISTEGNWQFQYERDAHNLGLNTEQCNIAFPGLFEEIHRAVDVRSERRSNVSAADLAAVEVGRGTTRALIVNGKLRVLGAKHPDEIQRQKGLAILYAISRAISSMDGRAIPNIEFVFSIDDMVENPHQPIWTLARRSQDHNLWLMPDFGFWSWNIQDLGTLDDVTEQIMRDEDAIGWGGKIQKLIWRGQLQMLPRLRRALVDVSKGKPWGDVAALIPQNYMSAADQCKYMFVAHAEGELQNHVSRYLNLISYNRSKLLRILKIPATLSLGNNHPQDAVDSASSLSSRRQRSTTKLCGS